MWGRKILITLLLEILLINVALAQVVDKVEEPLHRADRGKLFFSVAAEYRITPIYAGPSSFGPVNIDKQSSGAVLNLNLDYFLNENLSLGFTQGIRYDQVLAFRFNSDQGSGDIFNETKNDLILSYHFYADYHFNFLFNTSDLFLRGGISLLNGNTNVTEITRDNTNQVRFIDEYDSAYSALNFAIGYRRNKINLLGGIYTSSTTEYFNETTNFIVPYLSFKYTIGKL